MTEPASAAAEQDPVEHPLLPPPPGHEDVALRPGQQRQDEDGEQPGQERRQRCRRRSAPACAPRRGSSRLPPTANSTTTGTSTEPTYSGTNSTSRTPLSTAAHASTRRPAIAQSRCPSLMSDDTPANRSVSRPSAFALGPSSPTDEPEVLDAEQLAPEHVGQREERPVDA